MPQAVTSEHTVLDRAAWQPLREAHRVRVDALLHDFQARAERGEQHPIEDFLFTYYAHRPKQLRRWHPGAGVVLEDAADLPHPTWTGYTSRAGRVEVDIAWLHERRGVLLQTVTRLLRATRDRRPTYGCFGMHEWAMVYRQDAADVRHTAWPLRLGRAATDALVEERPLVCTHFDAYRFFTPAALPRNATRLDRASQPDTEQGGCLHANMDLYKWAYKLVPAVPSDLVLDCFELARDMRYFDMAASPYDFTDLGVAPVRVETVEGRAEYAAAQRSFADRAAPLRARLLAVCDSLNGSADGRTSSRVRDCD